MTKKYIRFRQNENIDVKANLSFYSFSNATRIPIVLGIAGRKSNVNAITAAIVDKNASLRFYVEDEKGNSLANFFTNRQNWKIINESKDGIYHATIVNNSLIDLFDKERKPRTKGELFLLNFNEDRFQGYLSRHLGLVVKSEWIPTLIEACRESGLIREATNQGIEVSGVSLVKEQYETKILKLISDGRLKICDGVIDGPGVDVKTLEAGRLNGFLNNHGQVLIDSIRDRLNPVHDIEKDGFCDFSHLGRNPFPAQNHAIQAIFKSLPEKKWMLLRGSMGVGKSLISSAAAFETGTRIKGNRSKNICIMVPPNLVKKTAREIAKTLPRNTYKIHIIAKSNKYYWQELQLMKTNPELFTKGNVIHFWIFNRNTAKLDTEIYPNLWEKESISFESEEDETGVMRRVKDTTYKVLCPRCGMAPMKDKKTRLDTSTIRKGKNVRKTYCNTANPHTKKCCGQPLWGYGALGKSPKQFFDREKDLKKRTEQPNQDDKYLRRYACAEFVKRYAPRDFFDLLIADEVHEYKSGSSAQGQALAALLSKSKYSIGMTGTLIGGYAKDIFHLLWRFAPGEMKKIGFGPNDEALFAKAYGVFEKKITTYDKAYRNSQSMAKDLEERVSCKPGISPALYRLVFNNIVSIDIEDISDALPPIHEEAVPVEPDAEWKSFYKKMKQFFANNMKSCPKLFGKITSYLLAYPDRPWDWADIYENQGAVSLRMENYEFTPRNPNNKEKMVLDKISDELAQGRKCLVFSSYTDSRDTFGNIHALLTAKGIKVERLIPAKVPTAKREEWIEKKTKAGTQVILTNPTCVETGLDLIAYPTIIYMNQDHKINTLRQSSRRHWRIGQTQPCKVFYYYYANTAQSDCLSLNGKKLDAALALEGKFGDAGLNSMVELGDDALSMLAKAIEGKIEVDDPRKSWKQLQDTHNTKYEKNDLQVQVEEDIVEDDLITNTYLDFKRKKVPVKSTLPAVSKPTASTASPLQLAFGDVIDNQMAKKPKPAKSVDKALAATLKRAKGKKATPTSRNGAINDTVAFFGF